MRYVEVTPDGRYVRLPGSTEKSSYGTMIFVRAYIVAGAASALAKGLTIAVRYSSGTRPTRPSSSSRALFFARRR